MNNLKNTIESPLGKEAVRVSRGTQSFLVLHNDDVNSFDYVIDSLIEVCKHEESQAEQCAYIAHYKGFCDIKKGSIDDLEPLQGEFTRRGIITTIE
jgi:ATP-dependent Clp protease adaptor protein ClpS